MFLSVTQDITNLHGSSVGVGSNVTTVGTGVALLHLADVLLGVVESLLSTGHFDSVVVVVEVGKCSLVDEL
jgi:hypothetical protein